MKIIILMTAMFATAPARAEPAQMSQHPRVGELCEIDFQRDSVRFPDADDERLGRIAGWAQQHPDGLIVLDAFADDDRDPATNVRLALLRAKSIRDELMFLDVDPDQVVLAAFGGEGGRRVVVWSTHHELPVVIGVLAQADVVLWNFHEPAARLAARY